MAQDEGEQVNHDSDSHPANSSNGASDSRRINGSGSANRSSSANDSSTINNPGRVSNFGSANYPDSVSDYDRVSYHNGVSDYGRRNYPNGISDSGYANYSNGVNNFVDINNHDHISDPGAANNLHMLSDPADRNSHEFYMMNRSTIQRPQYFVREGPVESQLTRLYLESGDSLQYGPVDPVDDFPPGSAFSEQVIEGDSALAELAESRGRFGVDNIDLGYPEGFVESDGASIPFPIPSVYQGQAYQGRAYRRNSERSTGSGDTNSPWYQSRSNYRGLQGRNYLLESAYQHQQYHHHRDRSEYQQGARRADIITNSLESAERSVAEDLEIIAGFGGMNGVGGARSSANAGWFTHDATMTRLPHVEDRFISAQVPATAHTNGMAYTTATTDRAQSQHNFPATNSQMTNGQTPGPGFRNGAYHGHSGYAFRHMDGFEDMTNTEIRDSSYQTSVFEEDVHQPMPEYLRRQLQRQLRGESSQDTSALRNAGGSSARFGDSSQQQVTGGRSSNSHVQTHIGQGRQPPAQWYPGARPSYLQPNSETSNGVHVNGGYINQEPTFNQSQNHVSAFGLQYLHEHIEYEENRIRAERLLAEHRGYTTSSAPPVSVANRLEAQGQHELTNGGLTAENLERVNQQLVDHQARLNIDQSSHRSQLPGPHSDRSEDDYYDHPH